MGEMGEMPDSIDERTTVPEYKKGKSVLEDFLSAIEQAENIYVEKDKTIFNKLKKWHAKVDGWIKEKRDINI